ncbi:hypothetical protein BKN38_03855 [Helicobacter sp. CLO-3]|uniref:hypothetical protein n=1 Tax=unclassified Helicobacter TaxID=2593540 RepID=UPI000805CA9F|nr:MULTISPECIES: hypothetical protein [unclassified Helicobacter]OBV29865.1 hypothetical protein BA723_03995 [Helicobacter sp. CLO-3]OHU84055.1 hypothetical protein BKN38_03855 [Helicobacter sp. CLO-3]
MISSRQASDLRLILSNLSAPNLPAQNPIIQKLQNLKISQNLQTARVLAPLQPNFFSNFSNQGLR